MSSQAEKQDPYREKKHPVFTMEGRIRSLILLGALILRVMLVVAGDQGRLLLTLLSIGILVAAIYVAADTKRHLILASALGVPALILEIITVRYPIRVLEWIALALAILLYLLVIQLMVRKIFRSRTVTGEMIVYALCIYVLFGQIWSMFYGPIVLVDPGAFTADFGKTEAEIWANATYYSFVTLTTLGYGDISPVAPLARALAVLEALTGTMFLTVMIGRLVGSYRSGE